MSVTEVLLSAFNGRLLERTSCGVLLVFFLRGRSSMVFYNFPMNHNR